MKMRHFDAQLMGGLAFHQGKIADVVRVKEKP
jgi:preprotein translocase subunit SecA